MLKIEIGSKLFANWGAMYPTAEYTVIDFDGEFVVAEDDEEVRRFHFDNIKREGERSVNGSPIGVFLIEQKPAFNPNPEFAGDWDDYYDC